MVFTPMKYGGMQAICLHQAKVRSPSACRSPQWSHLPVRHSNRAAAVAPQGRLLLRALDYMLEQGLKTWKHVFLPL